MANPYSLMSAHGVELEYMIVHANELHLLPIADELLRAVAGELTGDWENGPITWSNELVLHVIEFKTTEPVPSLDSLAPRFQENVARANAALAPMGAMLMPTAMHPWMDPFRETRLWPHEYNAVYEAYNRIFDCRGHGWGNLQSTHINLPFNGDEEFARLHAAIRLVLPLLPALAASSPVVEGRLTGIADNRLEFYRVNSALVPSLTGEVIPEPFYTEADYREHIFDPMFRDIEPHDAEGILRDEFLNSRGAIARFGRGSIEIRLLDIQECPAADVAIVALVCDTIRAMNEERWTSLAEQKAATVADLAPLLRRAILLGEQAPVVPASLLAHYGVTDTASEWTAGEVWAHLVELLYPAGSPHLAPLRVLLDHGTLSSRIRRALGPEPNGGTLRRVYERLCQCLAEGAMYDG